MGARLRGQSAHVLLVESAVLYFSHVTIHCSKLQYFNESVLPEDVSGGLVQFIVA